MTGRLRNYVRLALSVSIVTGLCGAVGAEDKKKRQADNSFHVLFADGSEVTGKSIDRWENHKSTSVAGRRLFDAGRAALFVRNTNRKPDSPGARIVLANGDVVPGRLVGVERAEDIPGRPVCLRIMPSTPLGNSRMPKAGIPISPRYVSRVISGGRSSGRSVPGTVLQQNGSFVSCQAMKWTPDGLRVLTPKGARTYRIKELADAYMPTAGVIAKILDDALAPCPQRDSLIVSLTTIGGARLTFRPAMMRVHEKRLLIQPPWSLNAIELPTADVWAFSVRGHDEVPLSVLPAETLAEKAFTGFLWRWRRDQSVRGGPLACGTLVSDLGVGTHAYSAIAFDLPRGAASFSFHAGLDNKVASGGCVRLKVCPDKADAKPLWTSGFMRGGDKPLSANALNCRDAKRLVLVTDFAHKGRPVGADPFDIRDEVNWIRPTVRLDAAVAARHYGGAVRYFSGLGGWSLTGADAGKAQLSAKWDNTDGRWEPCLLVGASGLTLIRKVHVTYDTASLWTAAVGREGGHKISLWIEGKQIKCANGREHLSTAGDPRASRWSLYSYLGKDVTLALKILPSDPRRVSRLTRPDVWFTREPIIIPTSKSGLVTWRYTTKKPGKGWEELKFDDSSWAQGPGMFGGKDEPGVRTKWLTKDIWIRRHFKMSEIRDADMVLSVNHDDAAEVYINGRLAAKFLEASYESYKTRSVSPEAKASLKVGQNVIAVHCNDIGGRRYIDVGLIDSTQSSSDDPHVVSRQMRYMPDLGGGMVRVVGKYARISGGGGARFDRELNAIAYWWRGKTWFSWETDVPKSGKYVVQLTYGCLSRAAGSTYEITVGDQKVRGVVRATGRWATFTTDDVGTIELDKSGPTPITLRLLNTPGKGIMTLHAVTLTPAK